MKSPVSAEDRGYPQSPSGTDCATILNVRTVLIVDDHAGFGFARQLLEAGGFEVVGEAQDGASAVAAVEKLRPDLVLLDIVLPDTDGSRWPSGSWRTATDRPLSSHRAGKRRTSGLGSSGAMRAGSHKDQLSGPARDVRGAFMSRRLLLALVLAALATTVAGGLVSLLAAQPERVAPPPRSRSGRSGSLPGSLRW